MYSKPFNIVLLDKVNADSEYYQIHARLGEVLFMSATSGSENLEGATLTEAIRRFCRSVELCDTYIRGYCGLKMV